MWSRPSDHGASAIWSSAVRWPIGFAVIVAGCNTLIGVEPFQIRDADVLDAPDADVGCCEPDPGCGAHATESVCTAAACTWTPTATCTGVAPECATLSSAGACDAYVGCAFDPVGPCAGTDQCSNYNGSANACTSHGCMSHACSGSHSPCAAFTAQVDCNAHACTYSPSVCSGTHFACGMYSDSIACINHECNWTGLVCNGTPHPCSEHTSASGCQGTGGCQMFTPASCTGTPHACIAGECTNGQFGCASDLCTGIPNPCSTYVTQNACEGSNCAWDGAGPCAGTAAACSTHATQPACAANDCTWSTSGGCSSAMDCASRDAAACGPGCRPTTICASS